MQGTLITTTSGGEMRPLAVQGILVSERYAQITNILKTRIDESHALLFAEPVFDRGQNTVDWYSSLDGNPVPLTNLDADRQNAIRDHIGRMTREIQNAATTLKGHGVAGEMLEKALHYPGEKYIFVFGNQPVVVGWGCDSTTAEVKPQDLSRLHTGTKPTPEESIKVPPEEPQEKAVVPPVTPPPPNSSILAQKTLIVEKKSGCLPWLLVVLLLLLLILLLANYFDRLPLSISSLMDNFFGITENEQMIRMEQEKQAIINQEINTLKSKVIQRKAECSPQKTANLPETQQSTILPEEQPLVQEPPLVAEEKTTVSPMLLEQKNQLEIPEAARKTGDVSFLEGKWVCYSGLIDSDTKQPLVITYAFNKNGNGITTASGPMTQGLCTGKAQGKVNKEGMLLILSDPANCPNGHSFSGQEIECRGHGASTRCYGKNVHTNNTWNANFVKQ